MDRLEEVFRLQKIRHPIERVVVDQNGAEQGLFRLDIVRRAPIGRSSRIGSELQNVRIKCGHGLDYASHLVVIGILGLGGDKAPLPGMVKARTRLMPDSHNARWESRCWGGLALDGLSGAVARHYPPAQ